jgi:hypothetical protein|tara:strand:- start:1741 stop:1935 length:195 start_codon:yes stop_codon:yes gene_type:complete
MVDPLLATPSDDEPPLPLGKLALRQATVTSLIVFFLLSVNCVSVITLVLSLSVIRGSFIHIPFY